MNKKLMISIVAILVSALVLAGFMLPKSEPGQPDFTAALQKAGISAEDVFYIHAGAFDSDGNHYKLVQSTMLDTGLPVIVKVMQNPDATWTVNDKECVSSSREGYASLSWFEDGGSRSFTGAANPSYNMRQTHMVYYGDNAKALVQLTQEQIPGNVTVSIQQNRNEYWIYVFSANAKSIDLPLMQYLRDNGCID